MFNNSLNNDNSKTKIIAITGGKGGIGKSIIALNFAIGLSTLKKKVLLLDADFSLANIDILMGIKPKYNISHVLRNECTLNDIIVNVKNNFDLIPAKAGSTTAIDLNLKSHYGLLCAFENLKLNYDYMIFDIASGLSNGMLQMSAAAHEVILVVLNEPTSIADAYVMIKLLNKRYNIKSYQILVNMTRHPSEGDEVFAKLIKVTERFLDVNLHQLGALPYDTHTQHAIKAQRAVLEAYPACRWSKAVLKLSHQIISMPNNCVVSEA